MTRRRNIARARKIAPVPTETSGFATTPQFDFVNELSLLAPMQSLVCAWRLEGASSTKEGFAASYNSSTPKGGVIRAPAGNAAETWKWQPAAALTHSDTLVADPLSGRWHVIAEPEFFPDLNSRVHRLDDTGTREAYSGASGSGQSEWAPLLARSANYYILAKGGFASATELWAYTPGFSDNDAATWTLSQIDGVTSGDIHRVWSHHLIDRYIVPESTSNALTDGLYCLSDDGSDTSLWTVAATDFGVGNNSAGCGAFSPDGSIFYHLIQNNDLSDTHLRAYDSLTGSLEWETDGLHNYTSLLSGAGDQHFDMALGLAVDVFGDIYPFVNKSASAAGSGNAVTAMRFRSSGAFVWDLYDSGINVWDHVSNSIAPIGGGRASTIDVDLDGHVFLHVRHNNATHGSGFGEYVRISQV